MNTKYRFALLACGFAILLATLAVSSTAEAQFGRGGSGRDFGRGGRGGGPGGFGGYGGGERNRGEGERRDGERREGDRDRDRHKDDKPGDSKPASGSSGSSDPKPDPAAELAKTKSWAEGVMKMNDKDNDHFLKGDEIKELRGGPAKADLNNDGAITVEELVANAQAQAAAIAANAPSGGSSSKSDSGQHREGDGKGGSDAGKRVYLPTGASEKKKSYRFSSSSELNGQLPDSLKSKDKNGDGQVSMSEFSRSWSKSTLADFRKYDLNDDGIITAKEAGGGKSSGSSGG